MDRPGRNDPCPCGSGKKYKNCCLGKDRASRSLAGAWREDEQTTLNRALAFAQQPAWNPQAVAAFNLFWNGAYGPEGLQALDKHDLGRFMDWYIHDFRLEGDSRRIIDLFLAQVGPSLAPSEQERLRAWQASYLSLYRINSSDDRLLIVTDTLQQGQVALWENGLGRLGLPGDLILGRVLHSTEPAHLSWAAILLPAAMEQPLVRFMRLGYSDYQETHPQASWPEFLSNQGYALNHYLLRDATESGQVKRRQGAYYDPSPTLARLREAETRLREQVAKKAEERRKLKRTDESAAAIRQTKGGILLPGHVQYKGSKGAD